jgi:hypothetical protein
LMIADCGIHLGDCRWAIDEYRRLRLNDNPAICDRQLATD